MAAQSQEPSPKDKLKKTYLEDRYQSQSRLDKEKFEAMKHMADHLGVSGTFVLDAVLSSIMGCDPTLYATKLLDVVPRGLAVIVEAKENERKQQQQSA